MFHKCCVLGCDSRRTVAKLHQFPKSAEIGFDNWLKCVSGYKQKSFDELRKLYVCEKHFEKRFITPKFRLRYGAYPTLFTAGEIANGFPDTPDSDIENWVGQSSYCNRNIDSFKIKHKDHNYCKKSDPLTEKDTCEPLEKSFQEIVALAVSGSCSPTQDPLADSHEETVLRTLSAHNSRSSSPTEDTLGAAHVSGHSSRSSSPIQETLGASHQVTLGASHQETLGASHQEIFLPKLSSQDTTRSCSMNFELVGQSFQDIVALAVSGSCSSTQDPLAASVHTLFFQPQDTVLPPLSAQYTNTCSPTQDTLDASHQEIVPPTVSAQYTDPCSPIQDTLEASHQPIVQQTVSAQYTDPCSPIQDTLEASHQKIVQQTVSGQDTSPAWSVAQDTLGAPLQEINTSTISDKSTPKVKNRRKRLVHRTASLSPDCKELYIEYKKLKRKVEFYKRTRKFVNPYTTEASFKKITERLTHGARTLMWMQLKQLKKKNKGRRFSREEKLYCVSVLQKSPECYKFLQNIFTLPSRTTLNKLISELNTEAGIYPHIIFPAIGNEVHIQDENHLVDLETVLS